MPNLPSWRVIGESLSSTYLPTEAITKALGLLGWGLWFYIVGSLMLRLSAHLAARVGLPGARRLLRLSDTVTPPQLRRLFDLVLGGAFVLSALTGPKNATGDSGISVLTQVAIQSNGSGLLDESTPIRLVEPQANSVPYYEVKSGDSLWRIAEHELGSGLRWREIFELNVGRDMGNGRLFEKSRLIYPGWQLLMPMPEETIVPDLVLESPVPSQSETLSPASPLNATETLPSNAGSPERVIRVELPDGTAIAGSFASGILAAAAIGRLRRRRIILVDEVESTTRPTPNIDAIRRTNLDPSVDVIGPLAESVIRSFVRHAGEVPNVMAAWEGAEATTVLLKSESEDVPKPNIDPTGQRIDFDRRASHIRAVITGPSVPRVRRGPFGPVDGLLVPAGFTSEGTLYVPLLGQPLCVSGSNAEAVVETALLAGWTRLGSAALRLIMSEDVGLFKGLNAIERFPSKDADHVASELEVEALRRKRIFAEEGVSSFALHVLENPDDQLPVILVIIEASASDVFRQTDWESLDVGISLLVLGDEAADGRRIIAEGSSSVVELDGLEPFEFEHAILAPGIVSEIIEVIGLTEGDSEVRPSSTFAGLSEPKDASEHLVFSLEEEVFPDRNLPDPEPKASTVDVEEEISGETPTSEYIAPVDSEILSRVSCLGGWRVEVEARDVEGELLQKGRELLALLIAHPRGLTRDRIIENLWPESDVDEKKALFQKYVSTVRNVLRGTKQSAKMIGKFGDVYRLDFSQIWIDVAAFEESIKQAKNARDPVPALKSAIDLYRGDFCQDTYYDWAEETRAHLRNAYVNAALHVAEHLAERQDFEPALKVIDRAIAVEKYAEVLYVKAMELESKLLRRDAIVRRFHRLEQLLADDLELEPADETVQRFNSLVRPLVPTPR